MHLRTLNELLSTELNFYLHGRVKKKYNAVEKNASRVIKIHKVHAMGLCSHALLKTRDNQISGP